MLHSSIYETRYTRQVQAWQNKPKVQPTRASGPITDSPTSQYKAKHDRLAQVAAARSRQEPQFHANMDIEEVAQRCTQNRQHSRCTICQCTPTYKYTCEQCPNWYCLMCVHPDKHQCTSLTRPEVTTTSKASAQAPSLKWGGRQTQKWEQFVQREAGLIPKSLPKHRTTRTLHSLPRAAVPADSHQADPVYEGKASRDLDGIIHKLRSEGPEAHRPKAVAQVVHRAKTRTTTHQHKALAADRKGLRSSTAKAFRASKARSSLIGIGIEKDESTEQIKPQDRTERSHRKIGKHHRLDKGKANVTKKLGNKAYSMDWIPTDDEAYQPKKDRGSSSKSTAHGHWSSTRHAFDEPCGYVETQYEMGKHHRIDKDEAKATKKLKSKEHLRDWSPTDEAVHQPKKAKGSSSKMELTDSDEEEAGSGDTRHS